MNILLICCLILFIIIILWKPQNKQIYINNENPIVNLTPGNYNIKLISAGENKLNLLKKIREITGLNLKDAMNIVNSAPSLICENIDEQLALEIKEKLDALGAVISIETNNNLNN